MELALTIIISILAFLLVLLLGVMAVLLYRYLKIKEKELDVHKEALSEKISEESTSVPLEVQEKISEAKKQKSQYESQSRHCTDHPEQMAKGICSLSGEALCELCLTTENDIKIGRKYLDLFLDNEWNELEMIHNDTYGKEALSEVLERRKELWEQEGIPVIIQNQFKINVEDDSIQSYTSVLVRDEDKENVKSRLAI